MEVKDPLNHTVTSQFDGKDRPTQMTDARGKQVTVNYLQGLLDWMEAPTNQGSGSNRRRTLFSHDNPGRVTQVDAQVGPSAYQTRVAYNYTGFSQIKSLIRLMNATPKSTDYTYDQLGRGIGSNDFLGRISQTVHAPYCVGHTTLTPRGVQQEMGYDSLCRLVSSVNQEEAHLFAYDELDRLIQARVGDRYAHGTPPNQEGSNYGLGVYQHDTQYRYDALDRVTEVRYPNGDEVFYQYDSEGNVTQMTDVHDKVTAYSYYNDGRLRTVTFEGQTFTYSYDLAGRLESIQYPASSGLVASFTKVNNTTGWDENGQLLCLRYLKGGNHFHRFEYTYDDSGNRISLVDTPENLANTVSWGYGYDWLNRLASVAKNGSTTSLYAYDESDNRISLTLPQANEVWSYAHDLADQILSRSVSVGGSPVTLVESFQHDDDGNMIARITGSTTTNYDWSGLNKLRRVRVNGVKTEVASYDAGGIRRLKKDGNGVSKSFSSGGMSLADTRPSGPVSFIQGHQLLGLLQGGNQFYMVTDGLSSVRVVVNGSGASVGGFGYDEFGIPDATSPPPAELRGHSYTGGVGVRNDETSLGLYYARQRYFDSSLGRWLSQDPIGFEGGLNLYAGMGNNPTTFVDPDGEIPIALVGFMLATWAAANLDPNSPEEVASMACEPLDWALTIRDVQGNGLRPLHLLTLLPFVSLPFLKGAGLGVAGRGNRGAVVLPHWKQTGRQRHHVVQDAAVKDLPGYSYSAAPTVGLPGQAKIAGTPHNLATVVQQQRGGGNLRAECRIAYKALRRSGIFSKEDARKAVENALKYFEALGHGPNTPTKIPKDRTKP